MKRSMLEQYELSKEQIDEIMRANGEDIENANQKTQQITKERDDLKEQIRERDRQLETLKKSTGDTEALKAQIEELQVANKEQSQKSADEIKSLKIDYAVDKALGLARAKNAKAVRALLDLTKAELSDDGSIKGLSEQIETLKSAEDSKFLFDSGSEQRVIKGAVTGSPTENTASDPARASYEARLAQARKNNDNLAAIQIKTEAAKEGVILM